MRSLLKYPLCAVLLIACSNAVGASLQVDISNADPADGLVYFALFDSRAAYDSQTFTGRAVSDSGDERPRAVFTDLPPGDYVVSVFQDSNGNRQFDTNLLGMPLEPFGFSRNAMGSMGRPAFEAAAVSLSASDETLEIEIELRKQP